MEFTKFQAFAYLFIITTFSLCGVVNVIWSWTLHKSTTPLIAPHFAWLSTFLTLAGVVELFLALLVFSSSYMMEKQRKLFIVTVIGSSLLMFVLLAPFSLSAARAAGDDFRQHFVDVLNDEIERNTTNGILGIAHTKFNCCGVHNEHTCLRDYPPYFKNATPCHTGSNLCSVDCLHVIWHHWVKPSKTFGWVLADISFAISIIGPVLFLTALYKNYAPKRNKRKFRGVNWRKLLAKSVKDAYGEDTDNYEHVPNSRYSF